MYNTSPLKGNNQLRSYSAISTNQKKWHHHQLSDLSKSVGSNPPMDPTKVELLVKLVVIVATVIFIGVLALIDYALKPKKSQVQHQSYQEKLNEEPIRTQIDSPVARKNPQNDNKTVDKKASPSAQPDSMRLDQKKQNQPPKSAKLTPDQTPDQTDEQKQETKRRQDQLTTKFGLSPEMQKIAAEHQKAKEEVLSNLDKNEFEQAKKIINDPSFDSTQKNYFLAKVEARERVFDVREAKYQSTKMQIEEHITQKEFKEAEALFASCVPHPQKHHLFIKIQNKKLENETDETKRYALAEGIVNEYLDQTGYYKAAQDLISNPNIFDPTKKEEFLSKLEAATKAAVELNKDRSILIDQIKNKHHYRPGREQNVQKLLIEPSQKQRYNLAEKLVTNDLMKIDLYPQLRLYYIDAATRIVNSRYFDPSKSLEFLQKLSKFNPGG